MQLFYLSNKINVNALDDQCTIANICLSTCSLVMPETCFMVIPEYWCREIGDGCHFSVFILSFIITLPEVLHLPVIILI